MIILSMTMIYICVCVFLHSHIVFFLFIRNSFKFIFMKNIVETVLALWHNRTKAMPEKNAVSIEARRTFCNCYAYCFCHVNISMNQSERNFMCMCIFYTLYLSIHYIFFLVWFLYTQFTFATHVQSHEKSSAVFILLLSSLSPLHFCRWCVFSLLLIR